MCLIKKEEDQTRENSRIYTFCRACVNVLCLVNRLGVRDCAVSSALYVNNLSTRKGFEFVLMSNREERIEEYERGKSRTL